tara:strand:- start:461 stop:682 length:222 start_codon:yes stop_codon:yes gene_type:complete
MRKYLLLLLLGCNEDNFIIPSGCLNEPDNELVCTMEIDYVCGCNGYFYANECWAMRDGNTSWTAATIETDCKK